MLLKIKIAILIIVLTICSNLKSYSQSSKHESLSYKIYFVNNFDTGVLFLTGDIDFKKNLLKIEYAPLEVSNNIVKVNIGEVVGNFNDIKILDSINIMIEKLNAGEDSKIKQFRVNNLKENMKIVIWIKEITTKEGHSIPIETFNILERTKGIALEQDRLCNFGSIKGKEALIIEVCRNIEE